MTSLNAGAATHVGRVRSDNEDAHYSGRRIWAVADGMGGHAAGEVASAIVIEAVAELDHQLGLLDRDAIVAMVERANDAVIVRASDVPGRRGMGTTLTGIALVSEDHEERLCVFNVGDSRVYRLARGQLAQVTRDHSEVADLIESGLITPTRAKTHPMRNVVTRCLGMLAMPGADSWLVRVRASDRYVICSDGLNGELSDGRIAGLATQHDDPQEAADALVIAAVEAGGHDNVTVVVVDVIPE